MISPIPQRVLNENCKMCEFREGVIRRVWRHISGNKYECVVCKAILWDEQRH